MKHSCAVTAAALSLETFSGFLHGAWATKPSKFEGIRRSTTPARYPGVPQQQIRNASDYWSEATAKWKASVSRWPNRDRPVFFLEQRPATSCLLLGSCTSFKYYIVLIVLWRKFIGYLPHSSGNQIGSEWMGRNNLFRRIYLGGLGLSHLFVRRLVSRFTFLRDIGKHFIRAVIRTQLARTYLRF